ncbi:1,3-beta-D-glucan synthase [Fusarium falciforme]|nr:1,3-beta-D-glucan synthase [Fusarium falciforme]
MNTDQQPYQGQTDYTQGPGNGQSQEQDYDQYGRPLYPSQADGYYDPNVAAGTEADMYGQQPPNESYDQDYTNGEYYGQPPNMAAQDGENSRILAVTALLEHLDMIAMVVSIPLLK